jgi:hypothetical protein
MRKTTRRAFLAKSGALAAVGIAGPGAIQRALAGTGKANMVFRNGAVLSFKNLTQPATCLAIRGNLIVYVGSDDGVADLIGPATEVIDLAGRTIMPGIHDAHMHPLYAGWGFRSCSLYYAQLTLNQMRDIIAGCLQQTHDEEPDGWLEVNYWDYQAIQPPGTVPTKHDLDVLDTARPIIVYSLDGHTALVNSRALALAGITAATPDPPDGHIVRDENGEPTGLLQDSATSLLSDVIPEPTVEQNAKALRTAIKRMNRVGITSYMDANSGEATLAAAANLRDAGRLTVRAQLALLVTSIDLENPVDLVDALDALRQPYFGGNLSAPTAKMFFDGVIEYPTHTAALLKPYRENTGTASHPHWEPSDSSGPTYFEPDLANAGIAALDAAGWQVHVHAIGDRAVRTALDAFEHARDTNGDLDHRHTHRPHRAGEPRRLPALRRARRARLHAAAVGRARLVHRGLHEAVPGGEPVALALSLGEHRSGGRHDHRRERLAGRSVDPLPPDRDDGGSNGRRDLSLLPGSAPP